MELMSFLLSFIHSLFLLVVSSVLLCYCRMMIAFISLFHTPFLGALTKLRKAPVSFMSVCLSVGRSVRPYGTTGLPLDGFL